MSDEEYPSNYGRECYRPMSDEEWAEFVRAYPRDDPPVGDGE